MRPRFALPWRDGYEIPLSCGIFRRRVPAAWEPYLSDGPAASAEFMEEFEDLPVQDRDL
jgi:hypothetical protein